jgi:prepilin-type N-terminal cleavage/methylation domain-containing protein
MMERREGFGLIEVMIAMLILTVGVLAMGASTGYILNQVRASELRTDRMVVVTQAAEQLRGSTWGNLPTTCQDLESPSDRFTVECELALSSNLALLSIISEGPAVVGGRVVPTARDTLVIGIAR